MGTYRVTKNLILALLMGFCFEKANADGSGVTDDLGSFSEGDAGESANGDSEFLGSLQMGVPSVSGTGCASGSAHVALSPDQRELTVLFDSYMIRSGGSGPAQAAANCTVSIPFTSSETFRSQVTKLEYRGFLSLPDKARMTIESWSQFLGSDIHNKPSPRIYRKKDFSGVLEKDFLISSLVKGPKGNQCSRSFNLNTTTSMTITSNQPPLEAISALDSLDASTAPVRFSLRWKRCK